MKEIGGVLGLAVEIFGLASRFLARPVQYLDPGSGSYLLQLLIAGALGALFALRLYWKRVKGFFSRLLGRNSDAERDES